MDTFPFEKVADDLRAGDVINTFGGPFEIARVNVSVPEGLVYCANPSRTSALKLPRNAKVDVIAVFEVAR